LLHSNSTKMEGHVAGSKSGIKTGPPKVNHRT
jgi:hypothetical protein